MSRPVNTKEVKDYWERFPAGWGELRELENDPLAFLEERDRRTRILSPRVAELYRMHLAKDTEVLDVGCGQGYNAQELVRRGARLIAIDLTSKGLKLATTRFAIRSLSAHFLLADAQHLPFNDESFGYVHSSGVIHHIPNMEEAVSEIHRVLRTGGKASIMVYNKSSWQYWYQLQFRLRLIMSLLYIVPTSMGQRIIKRKPSLSKYVPDRWPRTADIVNAGTDFGGIESPLSRVFSRRTARQLFHQFRIEGFATSASPYKPFTARKNLWERFVAKTIDWLNHHYGWYLYVYLEKRQ